MAAAGSVYGPDDLHAHRSASATGAALLLDAIPTTMAASSRLSLPWAATARPPVSDEPLRGRRSKHSDILVIDR